MCGWVVLGGGSDGLQFGVCEWMRLGFGFGFRVRVCLF